ncbi:MAG TPA: GNAT family N-acetyltransferase [Gryllotalpicola sp.]
MTDALDVTIAQGSDSDIDACVGIWRAALLARDGVDDPRLPERTRAKLIELPRVSWLVARGADHALGFALLAEGGTGTPGPHDPEGYAYLALLGVAPSAWGQGIATALLARLEEELARAGLPGAYLHVVSENTAAIRRYERAGWHSIGEVYVHPVTGRPTRSYARELA